MSDAELIFSALAELSTRQIAETEKAIGFLPYICAGKKGGRNAKNARLELEHKTGKKIVSSDNFKLPAGKNKKMLG